MANQNTTILHKVGDGVLDLFRQDHAARRYRSRLWYLLPALFNLPGGVVSFLAIRHDDMDKAKNCLLLGIILFIPILLLGIAAAATAEALSSVTVEEICAELAAAGSAEVNATDDRFAEILCN